MESSLEKMDISEPQKKSGAEPSSQVESNGKEAPSEAESSPEVESSEVEQASQEMSSPVVPSSSAAVSSLAKSSQAASLSLPSTSAEALQSSVSSDMENGHAQKKKRLDYESMPTGVYLDSTVVPILHVALVTLDRLRPADPVQFLINFLLRNKAQYSKKIPSMPSTNQA